MPAKTPHDKLFKAAFSHVTAVAALVREYLPKGLSENLDLDTLRQENTSYITGDLQEYFSDIVYSCRWKQLESHTYISLLLEHKSYQPDNIFIQLLRYLSESYHHQYQEKQRPLCLVLPIVVYHGASRWEYRSFDSYFDLPSEEWQRYLPHFQYEWVDLNEWTDDLIITREESWLLISTMLAFKHSGNKAGTWQVSRKMFKFVERTDLSKAEKEAFIRQLLIYLFSTLRFEQQEFSEFVKQLPAMTQILSGSLYEQLIEQGMQKGLQQGLQEGLQEGIHKGLQEGMQQEKLLTAIDSEMELLFKMAEQSVPFELMQRLLETPEGFLPEFVQHYNPEKAQALKAAMGQSRTMEGLEAIKASLKAALLAFGWSEVSVEAYLQRKQG